MMRLVRFSLALCFISSAALAHGPTPQKVEETVDIKAPPKAVWAIAGEFSSVAKWDEDLKASSGDNKSRKITFKNGESLQEDIDDYDAAKMTYTYRMLDPNVKALPASSYSATFTVTPGTDGGSHVEWISRVYRGDTGNEPPDELNDEAAKGALRKLFRSGLDGLKAKSEAKS